MSSHGPEVPLEMLLCVVVEEEEDLRMRGGVRGTAGMGRSERAATRSRETREVRHGLRVEDLAENEECDDIEWLEEDRFSGWADAELVVSRRTLRPC